MWSAILGGLLGAGGGYAAYAYSRSQQDACFTKNYSEPPVAPDATPEQKIAAYQQGIELAAQVSAACHVAHPVRSFLSDDMYIAIGGGLVVGAGICYFAFRKK
jgi:hypothetical protein